MGKTLFAVSTAALMVAFAVGWAIPNTQARFAPAASAQVDTFQIMTGAKQMPSEHFADYLSYSDRRSDFQAAPWNLKEPGLAPRKMNRKSTAAV